MENDNNVNGNLNDNSVLDALVLTREQWRSGIVKAVIFTLIAVIIFFVPITRFSFLCIVLSTFL